MAFAPDPYGPRAFLSARHQWPPHGQRRPSCRRPGPTCVPADQGQVYAVAVRAATNKCLARSNKFRAKGGATNRVEAAAGFASCCSGGIRGVRASLVSLAPHLSRGRGSAGFVVRSK
jgi:hypothetical protein